ncbi:hypothetical protein AB0P21_20760 [Kribbella sp. NPDC056861]|uniref:hypothetical protein n=1 Tax=Kribbella sp. NPDC056861 TaxID=3154857 RepID=UPI003414F34D
MASDPKYDGWQQARDEADNENMQQIDQASAVAQPSDVSEYWVEQKYKSHGSEQQELAAARGEAEVRPHQAKAAGLAVQVDAKKALLERGRTSIDKAEARYEHATDTLKVLTRRDRSAWYRYIVGLVVLALGDTAGILGAAISLGEYPIVAFGQALAVGFAGVASGQAGADLKDLRMSRQRRRDPDSLSEDEARYRHLFGGMEAGVSIMKMVGFISVAVVVIIAMGIVSLRLSVEGMASGIAFGGMAAATALGSFVSTYSYADDVADLLASLERSLKKAIANYNKLAASPVFVRHAEAIEMAKSLRDEHSHRGEAAKWYLVALSKLALSKNPGVAGHGVGRKPSSTGRRLRGDRK